MSGKVSGSFTYMLVSSNRHASSTIVLLGMAAALWDHSLHACRAILRQAGQ